MNLKECQAILFVRTYFKEQLFVDIPYLFIKNSYNKAMGKNLSNIREERLLKIFNFDATNITIKSEDNFKITEEPISLKIELVLHHLNSDELILPETSKFS